MDRREEKLIAPQFTFSRTLITFTLQNQNKMKRKITLDVPYFFGALLAFAVAYGLMAGYIQQYIHFAGALNEVAECVLAMAIGMGLMMASVEFPKTEEDGK